MTGACDQVFVQKENVDQAQLLGLKGVVRDSTLMKAELRARQMFLKKKSKTIEQFLVEKTVVKIVDSEEDTSDNRATLDSRVQPINAKTRTN